MLFNSQLFLFLFLPVILGVYYLTPEILKNLLLLLASLAFYAWGGPTMLPVILASIILNYIVGFLIENRKNKKGITIILSIGVILNLSGLCFYKYLNFVIVNYNHFLNYFDYESFPEYPVLLPLGISFFTFHGISYIVDVYRGKVKAQTNFIDHALYIAFFPQLIAGPIVRYHFICHQMRGRTNNLYRFASGVERFIHGLAKKMLLANTFAYVADQIFKTDASQLTTASAWLGMICYTMQIYYDFSGYSDMAIGLARMFGFEFPENFNFPYLATSIQDFWRRWHISLSTWFRDYLYIPLGGNRVGRFRALLNLFIVFLCTGFWHGASWTFLFWGLFHGMFIIIEKLGLGKILDKLWRPLRTAYVMIVVMIAWVFFRADNFGFAHQYINALVGKANNEGQFLMIRNYFNNEFMLAGIIGVLGAFGFFRKIYSLYQRRTERLPSAIAKPVTTSFDLLSTISLAAFFIIAVIYIASGSYSPFIYYRF